ncbi:MAG: type II toxin-antitoxin system HicB family antitoxin [Candidatus Altiarchaeota archaeon]
MYKFLIVYEKTGSGYSAYSPDLTGCVATGSTKRETKKNIRTALKTHLKGMIKDKTPPPPNTAYPKYAIL